MTDEPARRTITDAEELKLLAHPLRYRIARQLRHGPATSTGLARELGLNTGLTSYHLRQMAEHGFVEEVPELARGRERWWRARRLDIRFPPRSEQGDEVRGLMDEIGRLDQADDLAELARFQLARDDLEKPWDDAHVFSRGAITVTPEELLTFFEEYIALLYRYQRPPEETPEGARVVLTRMTAFPQVETSGGEPG